MIDDAIIERVARKICLMTELDPDEMVSCDFGDDMTVREMKEIITETGYCPRDEIQTPRWRTVRQHAENQIVGYLAVREEIN